MYKKLNKETLLYPLWNNNTMLKEFLIFVVSPTIGVIAGLLVAHWLTKKYWTGYEWRGDKK